MPQYKVIAKQQSYAFMNKHWPQGSVIDVPQSEVKRAETLCFLGKLERYNGEVKKAVDLPDEVMSRSSRVEPLTEAPGELPRRRGRPPKYERRDMTATDGPTGAESE